LTPLQPDILILLENLDRDYLSIMKYLPTHPNYKPKRYTECAVPPDRTCNALQ